MELRDTPENAVGEAGAGAAKYHAPRKRKEFPRKRLGRDLHTAAFLPPKVGDAPRGDSDRTVPISDDVRPALGMCGASERILEGSKAAGTRAFHRPPEFPDAMERGGFDVVTGNPLWERIKSREKEFSAARAPEIAAATRRRGTG